MIFFLFNIDFSRRLYNIDETFRETYIDYQTYLNALQFWKQSESDEAPLRIREYAELVRELEEELAEILEDKESLQP